MKFFLLIGAASGFVLSFAAGLLAGNESTIALRDGAIGCMAGALLMRGFSSVFLMALRDIAEHRAKDRLQKNQNASVN